MSNANAITKETIGMNTYGNELLFIEQPRRSQQVTVAPISQIIPVPVTK